MDDLEATLKWASAEPTAFVFALSLVQVLVLAIHELGHVIGAWSQRMTVIEYRLGLGPGLRVGRWGACAIVLGVFPIGGRVTYEHSDIPLLSRTLVSASGALCTGAAGMVGLAALPLLDASTLAKLFIFACFLDCALSLSPLASDGRKVGEGLWTAAAQRFLR